MFIQARVQRAAHCVMLASAFCADASMSDAHADNILAPIWTGAYAGIHGGGNWIDIQSDQGQSIDTEALTFGGHIGFALGLGPVIAGLEADLNYEGASSSLDVFNATGTAEIDASGTIRARLGIPFGPMQVYATAGYAWTDIGIKSTTLGGTEISRSSSFDGIVYGIGAEAFVLPNISLRIEALRYDYEADKFSLGNLGETADKFDPSSTVVRAGISFRFN